MINKAFLNNKFIKTIKDNKSWSISDKNKRPISIKGLKSGKIYGAKFSNPEDLGTVDEILSIAKGKRLSNLAYYLNSALDKFLIIDIESICKEDIKNKLLTIPHIYAEYSRSGKGIHLVCEIPDKYKFNKDFHNSKALKYEKDFELLLNHWVTFTGNQIKIDNKNPDHKLLKDIIENLLHKDEKKRTVDENLSLFNKIEDGILDNETQIIYNLPHRREIEKRLELHDYMKSLNDFSQDYSRYEFGMCGFYYYRLKNILKDYKDYEYTDKDIIYFLYYILKQKLIHREKHNEIRDNIPWLAYVAKTLIERN